MNYSRGPWKIVEDEDGETFIEMPDGHSIDICNIEGSCGTCYANARLIRAAPDMHQLLWELYDSDLDQAIIDKIEKVLNGVENENIRQIK